MCRSPEYGLSLDPQIEELKDTQYFIEASHEVVRPFGYTSELRKRKSKHESKHFTDEDLLAAKKLVNDSKAAKRLDELHESWNLADVTKRWEKLHEAWEKDKEKPPKVWHPDDPEEDIPGVFKVSQNKNNGYETFREFVVVARSEADARATHPDSAGDSFTYLQNELERNEEWLASGQRGPAPAWYLGGGDYWCHGAFVKVTRISDYKPPIGEEPVYGITMSHRFS